MPRFRLTSPRRMRHDIAPPPLDSASSLAFTCRRSTDRRRRPFRAGHIMEEPMDAMERRVFLKGAGMGMLAFTVGGAAVLMPPGQPPPPPLPLPLPHPHYPPPLPP